MSTSRPIAELAAANEKRQCLVKWCQEHRRSISPYCNTHTKSWKFYGNPTGKSVRPWQYEQEVKEVRRAILTNKENAAIIEGVALLQGWLEAASEGRRVAAREEMNRLYQAGVNGVDLLIRAAALFLFYERRKHHLDDGKEMTMQIGNQVLLTKPRPPCGVYKDGTKRYRPIGAVARRECGELIRKHLGFLLYNISQRVFQDELEASQRIATLRTPLTN